MRRQNRPVNCGDHERKQRTDSQRRRRNSEGPCSELGTEARLERTRNGQVQRRSNERVRAYGRSRPFPPYSKTVRLSQRPPLSATPPGISLCAQRRLPVQPKEVWRQNMAATNIGARSAPSALAPSSMPSSMPASSSSSSSASAPSAARVVEEWEARTLLSDAQRETVARLQAACAQLPWPKVTEGREGEQAGGRAGGRPDGRTGKRGRKEGRTEKDGKEGGERQGKERHAHVPAPGHGLAVFPPHPLLPSLLAPLAHWSNTARAWRWRTSEDRALAPRLLLLAPRLLLALLELLALPALL